jgi:hypothetical protein
LAITPVERGPPTWLSAQPDVVTAAIATAAMADKRILFFIYDLR